MVDAAVAAAVDASDEETAAVAPVEEEAVFGVMAGSGCPMPVSPCIDCELLKKAK